MSKSLGRAHLVIWKTERGLLIFACHSSVVELEGLTNGKVASSDSIRKSPSSVKTKYICETIDFDAVYACCSRT